MIAEVHHLSPDPDAKSVVKLVYDNGDVAFANWGSDIVMAWRAKHGDNAAIPYQAPPVSAEQINTERDRRIALGAEVTVGDVTFSVQTRDDKDFRNINGLATKGVVLSMQGDAETTVSFRDADNEERLLNGEGLISMADQVAQHVSAIYAASWALKAMTPIPADYAADSYWP